MKKVKFFILFVLIFAVCGLYAIPQAEVPHSDGVFGYSVENEKATIIVYEGSDEYLIIPEKVGGYEVTSIDTWHSNSWNYTITTLEISDSVIIYDLSNWYSLTEIILSEDHPVYGYSEGVLFDKTKNMLHTYLRSNTKTSYVIPDFITSIGDSAFYHCYNLITLEIPDSVISIEKGAFWGCKSLTTLKIPDSVTSIEEGAFRDCKNLALSIPKSSYAHKYALKNDIDFVFE